MPLRDGRCRPPRRREIPELLCSCLTKGTDIDILGSVEIWGSSGLNIVYRPRFLGQRIEAYVLSMRLKVSPAVFSRAEEAVGFRSARSYCSSGGTEQRLSQLLDGLESAQPRQVFLAGADEPLGTAIAFRCPDEGGRTLDAEEGDFFLELVGPVPRSVVAGHRRSAWIAWAN